MEDVAARKSEATLEIGRREYLSGDDGIGEVRREPVDGGENRVRGGFTVGVPLPVPRKVLAEEARDVVVGRCQGVVHRRRDQHLDDRRVRPTALACIEVGLLQVAQCWADDDS